MARKRKNKKQTEQDRRYYEQQLASYWNHKFKEAMVHKAPYTKRWDTYWEAYNGEYFKNKNLPDYKSDLVSNYIFSIIETIRPIMLDNDPKFQAMPRQPEGMAFSNDLQEAFSFEWDRERLNAKLSRELITTLVVGTVPWFIPWDSKDKQIKGIPINPYNFFPDPLATEIDDAEYLIYASYRNVERLKRIFPHHKDELVGGNVNYGELVYNNNENATLDNQVLLLEIWTRDYETLEEDEKGEKVQKYPRGRVLTIAPELGLVLADRQNPYKDGKFPFVLQKDYDIPGKFWGEGEVAQLLSPQKYMNELSNAILDNAKTTANMPWIVDKNSGVGYGKITSRPGLIIRKNPGSEVRREQPPSMPAYVQQFVDTMKMDMEQVSGVFDTLKGNSETGVYTAQGILALQEAGQARIRLKVKLMEDFLGRLGELWFSRMKQFWKEDKWIRVVKADGTYDFKEITKDALNHEYDIKIMAGSTMPVNRGAMLDLMIRLAQTQMPDGQTLVDREAVVEYLPSEVKSALLQRSEQNQLVIEQQLQELMQVQQQLQQQLEQFYQEDQQADAETDSVLEQLTSAFETINKKILQLEDKHARLEEEQRAESERNQIRTESYNAGYTDAERLLSSESSDTMSGDSLELGEFSVEAEPLAGGLEDEEGVPEELGEELPVELPDELLEGIENMTDDELALLLQQNPELADLL